jgi:hypothetical protein
MSEKSTSLTRHHRPAPSSMTAFLPGVLLFILLDSCASLMDISTSTTNSTSITITFAGKESYWVKISNSNREPNQPERYSFMNLSSSFDRFQNYQGVQQNISYYVFPNYTGFSEVFVSFSDECLFPILVASINKKFFPSITQITPTSLRIEQAVLGLKGFANASEGYSRIFSNIASMSSMDKLDVFDQSIQVSDGLSAVDAAVGVYCVFFAPSATQFSFDVKLSQKVSELNTHLPVNFMDNGNFTSVFAIPSKGSHHIHISTLPIKSAFQFNVTNVLDVAIEIDLIGPSGRITTQVPSNRIIFEQNNQLVIRILNKDKFSSIYLQMTISEFQNSTSSTLSGGAIAGIVVGSVVGFSILLALFLFRKKIFLLYANSSGDYPDKCTSIQSPEITNFPGDTPVMNVDIILPQSVDLEPIDPRHDFTRRKGNGSGKTKSTNRSIKSPNQSVNKKSRVNRLPSQTINSLPEADHRREFTTTESKSKPQNNSEREQRSKASPDRKSLATNEVPTFELTHRQEYKSAYVTLDLRMDSSRSVDVFNKRKTQEPGKNLATEGTGPGHPPDKNSVEELRGRIDDHGELVARPSDDNGLAK